MPSDSSAAEIRHATVGRPVRFVGAETEADDAFAQAASSSAFSLAGFEQVDFVMEPEAAAYAYEATLDRDELILIGDFGGGTSDFSLLRVGPKIRRGRRAGRPTRPARQQRPRPRRRRLRRPHRSQARLTRARLQLAPAPGRQELPAVPAWIYTNLERWHYLSFLRTRNVAEILKSAHARAIEPEKIEALITLVNEDLGFQLHQAVQRLKYQLSSSESAEFRFIDGTLELRRPVTRAEFECWIAEDLAAIENCIDSLFQQTHVSPREVDRVFLTGGTSFVPAVRAIFERRFSTDCVRSGNEFTSVARGLALHAHSPSARLLP